MLLWVAHPLPEIQFQKQIGKVLRIGASPTCFRGVRYCLSYNPWHTPWLLLWVLVDRHVAHHGASQLMLKCAEKLNCQGRLCCCTGPFPLLQAPAYLGTLVGGDPPAPMPTHCCPEEATRLHHCEESHDAACLGCAEGIHFANEEFHSRKGMYHHYIVAGGRWLLF